MELIKGGKPITPTSGGGDSPLPPLSFPGDDTDHHATQNSTAPHYVRETPEIETLKKTTARAAALQATPLQPPSKNGSNNNTTTNGNVQNDTKPGAVDVKRGTIAPQKPADANQVEHVIIKKKPKCQCCVIQ